MDISSHIDAHKTNNFNAKINCELEYLKNVGILTPFENGYDIVLEERIALLEKISKQPGIYQNNVQQQKETIFKEIDKYTYKKQWNKLPPFHKTVKLTEYLDEHIQDKQIKNELLEKLKDHATNGRINTKKYVVYDPNEEKILLLPCLKVIKTDKGDTYKIDVV
ncbi:hypothetical protein Indivirus_3_56 [Indivirus ILV1]|uniref:Uncharacterized protein n=1 Tax=Indivirus ILV1 TaxID=1977633 RepID=A0A1V0SDL8_9VIRU|nr:hypothetical protein Indivirus_3_56 [Indivirus ILV1]